MDGVVVDIHGQKRYAWDRALWRTCVTPILTGQSFEVISHSPKQTFRIGERLGSLLQAGDVVCLGGELGSGKTCLTQGIGSGLHVSGKISSPSFVFIREHGPLANGPPLYHVDLYRMQDYRDALALGLEDYVYDDGVTVIEWPERALEIMPDERMWVRLAYLDYGKRSLVFGALGERHTDVLLSLKKKITGDKAAHSSAPNETVGD